MGRAAHQRWLWPCCVLPALLLHCTVRQALWVSLRSLGCDGQRDGSGANPKGTVRDKEKELPPIAKAAQERSAGNQSSKTHKQQSKADVSALTSSGVRDQPQVVNQKSLSHRNALESAACTENTHKNGVASVELNPVHLLAGEKSVTDYLVSRTPGIREGLCSITVDKALMSEELRMKLNPLVITVLSATSLPASPVPFHVLKEKCLPVYCQYKLPDMTMHRTKGEEHGSDLYFRDVNVILTGLLDPDELQQYLGGPPLEIEIHDRDRKLEEPATSPTVFGTEAEDNRLGSVSLLSCRRTRFNPFVNSTSRQDPYGIATVDLSELLRGQRRFKATAAIKCSPPPDLSVCRWAEHEERMLGFPGVAYGPLEDPMPMGHYFEANSELKVQVEIAHPLKHNIWHLGYPFGRIIYFFRCKSSMALTRLRSEILKINAAAFHLNSATEEMIEKTLSCYEMSASEKNSKEMDVVTGFYLYDNKTHLFVLEGLKDKAIRRLWEKVPIKLSGSEEDQTKILYNSDQSFSTRLYHTLDLSLSPIHLHEALDNIMKQPLLYVREMVPRACFQALSRLSYLFQVKTMKDAVHGELFPSAEMILSMSKEFGIIPLKKQQEEVVVVRCEMQESPLKTTEKLGEPADTSLNDNMELMEDNEEEQHHVETKDIIEGNIEEVHLANLKMEKPKLTDTDSSKTEKPKPADTDSLKMEKSKPADIDSLKMEKPKPADTDSLKMEKSKPADIDSLKMEKPKPAEAEAQLPVDNVVPNYNMTQSENCTQQAWELLRKKMAKGYHSTTVASVDADVEQRSLEVRSKATRHTRESFVLPGFRSSMDSNKHPLKPDEARIEELRQPWKENILHSNILRPTLTRDTWPWSKRFEDFNLYKKPSGFFDSEVPVTIHLAGELLQQEQREAAKVQYSRWLRKVLPSEASLGQGPVPEFKCHMVHGESGKLGDLLKDKPMKYSLRTPGLELKGLAQQVEILITILRTSYYFDF
ncbi:uncharacterized protein FLJ43738 [Scleropages formosus]|uniref:uncharacterized protein FLJ43738 n=1 Tax=Scleropages formosus TaxID=113540 RepID=UPI0010FAB497|nr:uncharacterized protein KIAA1257 homolog [Scleropages formosus]